MAIKLFSDKFLITPIDPAKAALIRFPLAIILAFGLWPRQGDTLEKLTYLVPDFFEPVFSGVVLTDGYFALCYFVLLVFFVGWKPEWITPLLLLLLVPFFFINEGRSKSWQILMTCLTCMCFIRHSERFSLKSILQPIRQLSIGPIWPVRLLQIQLSLTYAVNALSKSTIVYLSGDTFIHLSQKAPHFLHEVVDGKLPLGPFDIPVALAAWGVVVIEYFLSVGFWFRKIRIATAIVGLVFHFLISFYIDIYMLHFATVFLYLSFLMNFDQKKSI